jgi:hypothetical protein
MNEGASMVDANVMTVDEYRDYIQKLVDAILTDEPGLSYIQLEDRILERIAQDRAMDLNVKELGV